jgi:gamma-glutamyltranspeptidase
MVELPRWTSFPSTDPAHLPAPFELQMEAGFPPDTLGELEALGHTLRPPRSSEVTGGMQAIRVGDGIYEGASDPRVDGCAVGF